MSSNDVAVNSQVYGKLHKPPFIEALHERPRKRLQKRNTTSSDIQQSKHNKQQQPQSSKSVFVLEYDPYPYDTKPGSFLGVYSTIDTVTAGAFRHGAYTFSREGLIDGSEYLSPNGRIKIVSNTVQHSGPTAVVPEKTKSLNGEPVRLDIPHPGSRKTEVQAQTLPAEPKNDVFLAVHESPQNAFCIGVFRTKSLAWGACLKDKAWLAWSDELVEEQRSIREGNMPETSARLVGRGRQSWFVKGCEVDRHRENMNVADEQAQREEADRAMGVRDV